ncbi:hypothetical protein [Azospirillum sp. B4]|uniref:hypothetical protein n=1 Tax=Azospirillum sp. B4 TaxID=95605 RepID=UPI0003455CEC|nr:hypothetical protein [Azospirillum sp. B4]
MDAITAATSRPRLWMRRAHNSTAAASAGEVAGLALIAQAMGLAARRQGHALLSNPFDSDGAEDVSDGERTAAAWRDGWLSGC